MQINYCIRRQEVSVVIDFLEILVPFGASYVEPLQRRAGPEGGVLITERHAFRSMAEFRFAFDG